MNDEIKEILDRLKYIVFNEIIDYGEELSLNECKLLLDCFTNLQQELEEEKRIEEADLKTIQRLEEENERLKEEKDNLYLDNTMLKLEKDIYKQGYEDFKNLLNILQNGSDGQ